MAKNSVESFNMQTQQTQLSHPPFSRSRHACICVSPDGSFSTHSPSTQRFDSSVFSIPFPFLSHPHPLPHTHDQNHNHQRHPTGSWPPRTFAYHALLAFHEPPPSMHTRDTRRAEPTSHRGHNAPLEVGDSLGFKKWHAEGVGSRAGGKDGQHAWKRAAGRRTRSGRSGRRT